MLRNFTHPTGWAKWGEIEPPIAAIRARKLGPVNWHGEVRDFR